MKRNLYIVFFCLFLTGCIKETNETQYSSQYRPILMTRSQLEKSIYFIPPMDLKNPGKIYLKDKYIFINEILEGIHIIDNQDPSNPVKVGFINVPGSVDMALKSNILYVLE